MKTNAKGEIGTIKFEDNAVWIEAANASLKIGAVSRGEFKPNAQCEGLTISQMQQVIAGMKSLARRGA